ncbi:MAG TPA: ABC transporter ATP-binding protein [Candidatus Saccharimonadales bacterium]|nr:ABC transporter ATP-binding protein [Candidatus Saccharimonadales bacterium]
MSDGVAISVQNVSKVFRLPHERNDSLKSAFIHFYDRNRTYEKQQVLNDVSFEVKKGEFFGIVGRNGSGKSTLLKMLAGIYAPSKGGIHINGKLTPFIELGVGFNPELTGRENVFLNGALLGFNRKEMRKMYKDIVDFAELEKFMDQKLKNYSSGMQVRLAFSIAIRAQSDILVLDEVLAVGDANFQQKCLEYFYELKRKKQTVVLVTHDMGVVKDFCDRAILIHDGVLRYENIAAKVAEEYAILNAPKQTERQHGKRWGTSEIKMTDVEPVYPKPEQNHYGPSDDIVIDVNLSVKKTVEDPIIGITIKDLAGREIFVTNTKALDIKTGTLHKNDRLRAKFVMKNVFNDGTYTVTPAIAEKEVGFFYDVIEDACRFKVLGWPFPTGIAQADTAITISKAKKERVKK